MKRAPFRPAELDDPDRKGTRIEVALPYGITAYDRMLLEMQRQAAERLAREADRQILGDTWPPFTDPDE